MNKHTIDLTNSRYGNLFFIKPTQYRHQNGYVLWSVKCDCGKKLKMYHNQLKHRKELHCGCHFSEKQKMIGKKFNKWTLIKVAYRYHGFFWNVKCKCGVIKIVSETNLLNNTSKSCGCSKTYKEGKGGLEIFYKRTKLYAKYRRKAFNLSFKEFKKLVIKTCYYCGSLPMTKVYHKHKKITHYFNGLDRIDSNYGYSLNNVVSCCKICNRAKLNMNINDFKNWIKQITNNQKFFHCKMCGQKR